MAKPTKIADIKGPNKVVPSATARPIIVGNGPALTNDPMMTPGGPEKKDEVPTETLSHTAKVLVPVSTPPAQESETAEAAPETSETPEAPPAESDSSEPTPETESDAAETPTVAIKEESTEEDLDPEATKTAAEAVAAEAKAKREAELEAIIESGKYAVPINAVQRKRSRITTILLCVLAVVLLVALLDVVADVGVVKLPSSVPHTHFFSKH
jgi:hypothetical protein